MGAQLENRRIPWIRRLPAERQGQVLGQLDRDSSPGFDFFLLVVLSCAIATFGLVTDSAAVIIGAMLVAPLMSPILGLSLASVKGERRMFERAVLALAEGALLAIVLSALLAWLGHLLPFGVLTELPNEVLARTHPTPFDLGIALAGGAAAAYALAQPNLSAALPGVAIATALMPPLCTVGIGVALGRPDISLGALLLFLTNFAAISFAGIVVFVLLGFRPAERAATWHGLPNSLLISAGLVLLVTVPLVVLTVRFVGEAQLLQDVRAAVAAEIAKLPDEELVDVNLTTQGLTLNLGVTIRTSRPPTFEQVVALQAAIAERLQRPTALQLIVVPTTTLNPLVPPTHTPTPTVTPTTTPSPTSTSGPSATATSTTSPSNTPLPPTSTPTVTATPTSSPTSTATFTPTPVPAIIAGTGGVGVALRDGPAGKIIGFLPDGAHVQILPGRATESGVEWVEMRDLLSRSGWVIARFLKIVP